jgi:hypothetical protein
MKRPLRDATPLTSEERPLFDDFVTTMERALTRRRQLSYERVEVPVLGSGRVVMCRSLAGGEPIELEECERRRQQNKPELDKLERAMLQPAKHAKQLFALFRPDVLPSARPLAPGVIAAHGGKGGIESEDHLWERAKTWGERLRGLASDAIAAGESEADFWERAKTLATLMDDGFADVVRPGPEELSDNTRKLETCIRVIQRAYRELKANHNALKKPVPIAKKIVEEFKPRTTRKHVRKANSVLGALSKLGGPSKDKIKRAVRRSDEEANTVPVVDAAGRLLSDENGQIPTVLLKRADWFGRTVRKEHDRRKMGSAACMVAAWVDEPPLDPPTAEEQAQGRRIKSAVLASDLVGPRPLYK